MIKNLASLLLGVFLTLLHPTLSFSSSALDQNQFYSLQKLSTQEFLVQVPKERGTGGVILMHYDKGTLYFLLGREDINSGKSDKAGQFCDLGGSVELDGNRIIDNIIRELKEESMGQFDISAEQLLQNGYMLYKKSPKGREIFYIFYPLDEKDFIHQNVLNQYRKALRKQKNIPETWLEKDQFIWVKAEDLLKVPFQKSEEEITVQDINSEAHKIKLRKYFIEDCLEHPAFERLLKILISSYSSKISAK